MMIQSKVYFPTVNGMLMNYIGLIPAMGVRQNGWFTMKIPMKIDDFGVPPF